MRPIEISNDEFTFDFTDSVSVRWVHASESSHQESGPHAMEYYVDDETIDRRFGHALDALLADYSVSSCRSLSLAMDFPSERRTEVNAAPARHVYCGDRPLNWLACHGTTKMDI